MSDTKLNQAVVLSLDSVESDELSHDALLNYVDYYRGENENGGFSQFVYNTGWEPETIRCVREGLQAMGATQNFELFNQSASIIDRIGPDGMEKFFGDENEVVWKIEATEETYGAD